MIDVATIEFLQALYPDPVRPGRLLVWTCSTRNGKHRCRWLHTLGEAATVASRQRRSRQIWFSAALHDPKLALRINRRRWSKVSKRSARGSDASAVALPALWAEIEIAGSGRPGAQPRPLPPDRDAGFQLFERVAVPPSIIVDAGGAYQAYWVLDKLLLLETDRDRAEAKDLLRRLQGALHAAALARGWWVDHDADFARPLRLPGTRNLDRPGKVWVGVEHFPRVKTAGAGSRGDHRYAPEDFQDLPAPPAETPLERLLRDAVALHPGPRADFQPIAEGCGFVADCILNAQQLEDERWQTFVRLAGRCFLGALDGRGVVHHFGAQHPGYNPLQTEETLALVLRDPDPPICHWIEARLDAGNRFCHACAHRGLIRGPFELGLPAAGAAPALPGAGARAPIAATERSMAPARSGADRAVLPPGDGDEQAAVHDLVFGLAEIVDDLGRSATARQIVRRLAAGEPAAPVYPRLRSALAALFPHLDGELPSSHQLAGRLCVYRGRIVGGAFIDRIPHRYRAARWTVRTVTRP